MSGFNTIIENLRQNLINDINNSQLPVGIVYYVAKDVFTEIERGYKNALDSEKQTEKTEEAKEEEKE